MSELTRQRDCELVGRLAGRLLGQVHHNATRGTRARLDLGKSQAGVVAILPGLAPFRLLATLGIGVAGGAKTGNKARLGFSTHT